MNNLIKLRIALAMAGWVMTLTSSATTERYPLWEVGMGVAAINFPDYRGSSHQQNYLLPLPYFIYRGEVLKVTREGLQGLLYQTDKISLNLSLDGAVPVKSENGSRQGMPNLDMIFEIGPSLKIKLAETATQTWKLTGHLPIRAAYATDLSHLNYTGWLVNPQLNLDYVPQPQWKMGMAIGILYANRDYHNYYYGVAPEYATSSRAAYVAERGYSGSRAALAVSWKVKQLRVGAFVRYDDLHQAEFEHSPLVEQSYTWMAGIGIAWVFSQSPYTVEHSN